MTPETIGTAANLYNYLSILQIELYLFKKDCNARCQFYVFSGRGKLEAEYPVTCRPGSPTWIGTCIGNRFPNTPSRITFGPKSKNLLIL
jgi:hypothetical protein